MPAGGLRPVSLSKPDRRMEHKQMPGRYRSRTAKSSQSGWHCQRRRPNWRCDGAPDVASPLLSAGPVAAGGQTIPPGLWSGACAPLRLIDAGLAGRGCQRRYLTGFDPNLAGFQFVVVFEKTARWWTRGAAAIGIICAAVTRAHEQSRLRIPPHRTAKMGAVNRKDLQLVGRNPPHPARNVAGIAIPRAHERVAVGCEPGLAFGELRERPKRYPGQFLLHLIAPGRAEDVADHGYCE